MGMETAAEVAVGSLEVDDVQIRTIARLWVMRALSRDDPERYRQLLADLKNVDFDDHMSVASLEIRLRALSESVSYIKEHHDILLDHILYISFWNCSLEVCAALQDLVVNLAASNGLMVPRCLDMLVRNFLPPSCCIKVHLDSYTEASLARKQMTFDNLKGQYSIHMSRKKDVMGIVHSAIRRISELVPIASLRLERIIQQRMPHKSIDKEWNGLYIENMLRLDAASITGCRMLNLVVDRLIDVDVEIAWEDIVRDEPIFSMETGEEDEQKRTMDLGGPGSEAQIEHVSSKQKKRDLGLAADKMDLLMDLTLQHLEKAGTYGKSEEMYRALHTSFRSTILTTHRSKFTQFLMFYLCSLAPTSAGNFADYLWKTFENVSLPKITRMLAAAYLASYLARARYVSTSTISAVVAKLVSWCVRYAPSNFSGFKFADIERYGVFYSACQASMYVLCFRMRELYEDLTQRSSLKSLKLRQLIDHKLKPLRVCLPSVVDEFLRQSRAAQLVETNEKLMDGALDSLSSREYGGEHRLDMFFPFDPYLLRESSRYIEPIFSHWSMVRPLYETEEDGTGAVSDADSSDVDEEPIVEDEEPVEEEAEQMVFEEDNCAEVFRNSLECMSITPPKIMPANLSHMLSMV